MNVEIKSLLTIKIEDRNININNYEKIHYKLSVYKNTYKYKNTFNRTN